MHNNNDQHEAKAAEDARRAAEAKAAEDARRAAEAKAAEDARRAVEGGLGQHLLTAHVVPCNSRTENPTEMRRRRH